MKKAFVLLLLALILPAFIGCSSTPKKNPPPHRAKIKKHPKKHLRLNVPFAAIDTDGNRMVGLKEFKKHFPKKKQKLFKRIDKNKDKFISPGEWHAFRVKRGFVD